MILKCLYVFFARIIDVSLGTIRTVYFVKGKTIEPFIIAFFEVLIWFAVAKEALNSTKNSFLIAFFYALGYAFGTYLGSKISSRLIKGTSGVQAVVNEPSNNLIDNLRNNGYAVSVINLKKCYDDNNKNMLYIQVNNSKLKELINIIKKYDNNSFIAINETKIVHNGYVK